MAVIGFALVLGTLAALLEGYHFGGGDQIEQLPLILRALDPSFAPGDFYINASQGFSPRTYYVQLVAALARVLPLPAVSVLLAILGNAAVTLVTWLAARDLLRTSAGGAALACVLVMAARGIAPGGSGELHYAAVVPATPAKPLLLLSLWAALRLRPVASAALALAATVLHPLLGIVAGLIALASTGLNLALGIGRGERSDDRFPWRALAVTALAGVGLVGVAWGLWFRHYHASLPASEFVDTMARVRFPHHRLPSAFPRSALAATVAFLLALVISWRWQRADPRSDRGAADRLLIPVALTVLLMIGGWVFVEVIPTRLFTTAQAFRFVFIPKWLGLMLFAATIARLWRERPRLWWPGAAVMFTASGTAQGIIMLWGHVVEAARGSAERRRQVGVAAVAGAGLLGALLLQAWRHDVTELCALGLFGLLAFAVVRGRSLLVKLGVPVAALAVTVALLMTGALTSLPVIGPAASTARPTLTLEQTWAEIAAPCAFARAATPPDAIFLTPPDLGGFRLLARRAIVVDFKAFPFSDEAIVQWRQRMADCYGPVSAGGFPAA
ncbi:MAG TPA: DUF6798 domain-containing protein, partial [Armatimonadota bacterium]|nr:DUF6798 domain-containing protein [Armatimonadota bacterium]